MSVLAGGNAVAIRFSNRELDPLWGAGLRFALAAALLVALMAILRLAPPRGRALRGAVLYRSPRDRRGLRPRLLRAGGYSRRPGPDAPRDRPARNALPRRAPAPRAPSSRRSGRRRRRAGRDRADLERNSRRRHTGPLAPCGVAPREGNDRAARSKGDLARDRLSRPGGLGCRVRALSRRASTLGGFSRRLRVRADPGLRRGALDLARRRAAGLWAAAGRPAGPGRRLHRRAASPARGRSLRGFTSVAHELRDVAPGLWIWRVRHPDWAPHVDWEPFVTSTCLESGGEVAVLDPLAPPEDAGDVWARLDAKPPTIAVVLKPDHVRDVDVFVRRYGAKAYGPSLFWRHNIPETELEPIEPASELPGGLVALYDGRGRNETPLWLPEQGALVFADALTERNGDLLVWATPWHEERVLPALRALLDLPFEHVIVSHGEPVHDRAAYERALKLPPWSG